MNRNTTNTVGSHGNGNNGQATNATAPKRSKQDANLRKTGYLRFQIGLILSLILVYLGLEATFAHKWGKSDPIMAIEEGSLEYYPEMNVVQVEKPLESKDAPLKRVPTKDFEIVPDDMVTEEGTEFIEKPREDVGQGSLDPSEIAPIKFIPEIDEVPFFKVEDAPIFPGCEDAEDKRACFNEMMQRHIQKHIRYPEVAQQLGIQGRVHVAFKIGADGSVRDVQMRGPAESLEEESGRLIAKLPKMTPGKQRGRAVTVPYSIPITFKLQR
ncbi:MAG: TonB family protein [Sediminicola sp.]|tara:strand:+ start:37415 stop:38221 length:807 start_codon:yes stop_codon:yes gene_type:complete